MRVRASKEELKRRKRERDIVYRKKNRDRLVMQSRVYYQNHKESILKKEHEYRRERGRRKRYKNKTARVEGGIEEYITCMSKYYTKRHRQRCYQQLKKDFEEIQQRQHLQVA